MKTFPILGAYPGRVPYDFVKQFEDRAKKNHCGQDIDDLASRGGLSWQELYYVIKDMQFNEDHRVTNDNHLAFKFNVLNYVNDWICNRKDD